MLVGNVLLAVAVAVAGPDKLEMRPTTIPGASGGVCGRCGGISEKDNGSHWLAPTH
jgi:hypothetical protein